MRRGRRRRGRRRRGRRRRGRRRGRGEEGEEKKGNRWREKHEPVPVSALPTGNSFSNVA